MPTLPARMHWEFEFCSACGGYWTDARNEGLHKELTQREIEETGRSFRRATPSASS
jgi:Zn-finger nucleic acid-binding protein